MQIRQERQNIRRDSFPQKKEEKKSQKGNNAVAEKTTEENEIEAENEQFQNESASYLQGKVSSTKEGNVLLRKAQSKVEPGVYTSVKGDTFASIAEKFNITVEELLKFNSTKYKLKEDGKTIVDSEGNAVLLAGKELINVPADKPMNLRAGHAGKYKYVEFLGTPFVKGEGDGNLIDPNDVAQGALGDCYFMAAMAAVARANPNAIKDLIKDNGNGTYNVTLYVDKKDSKNVSYRDKHIEVVDSNFPSQNDNKTPAYARFGDKGKSNELWPMLLEKAYAQYEGSYAKIDKGFTGEAIELLTGMKTKDVKTTDLPIQTQFKLIELSLKFNSPVACSAYPEPKDATKETDKWNGQIRLSHAYAPISVDMKNMTIKLQNPWISPKRDVVITSTEFKAAFKSIQFIISK